MKNIAALLFIVLIAACSPSRPGNIPSDAFWVNGQGANVWLEVGAVEPNKFYATIYHEDGARWVSGWFVFSPPPKDQNLPKGVDKAYIQKYMSSFNGTTILLTDFAAGRTLIYELQK